MNRPLVWRGAAGLILAALLVGGCAAPVPTPDPSPAPSTPQPVLSTGQDQKIVDAVGKDIDEADTKKDASLLDSRVMGPALAMRTAQIQIATGLGKDDPLTALPTQIEQMVIPTTQTWPRTSYAVTAQPQDLSSNRLLVYDQDNARDEYKLWGWARLFPGVTVPTFAQPEAGSAALAPDDTSLALTPADAVAQYADVLTMGNNSAFAGTFGDDPFRKAIATQASLWTDGGLTAAGGTYAMTFAVDPNQPIYALQTKDGGAVVVGALNATESIAAPEGAVVPAMTESQRVLLGGAPDTNSLTVTYADVVAIYVPKAGSSEGVRVLGTEHQVVGATR